MSKFLPDGKHGVYLSGLKRPTGDPKRAFKVGYSSFIDPMNRLAYQGPDEPSPLIGWFPEIEVMMYVICDSKEHALRLEEYVIKTIQGNDKWFHNWYEKPRWPGDCPSGVREIRKHNWQEIFKCVDLLEEQAKLHNYTIIYY
jgi:hypothetical protein